nr:hypothetical protein [Tanacetum cinerariifolium]
GSYIHYALTVNPHIYISCIKQFWNTASVKRSDDITRLQALVDRKKIVISEDVIHEILQLDDAEGVDCLPNEEIFAGLAQMGYEKPSTKLTFYKAFFSSQWKFLIHTLLQLLSAKRNFWNEFSSVMASADGKGFSGVETPLFEGMLAAREIAEEGIAEEQVQANDAVTAAVQETVPSTPTLLILPSPPSHDIPSTSQVQSSPPQQPQSLPQALPQGVAFPTHLFQQVLDTCFALTRRVENLEHDKAAQKLEIIKLKPRVERLKRANKVKSSKLRRLKKVGTSQRIESFDDMEDVFNQGRMIDDLNKDEGIKLVVDQVKDADTAKTEGRHVAEQAEKQAEIYHLDLDHPSKVLSMQDDDSEVQEVVEPSIPAAAPTVVVAYTRRRKGVIIRDPKEELSSKTPAETLKLKKKGKVMKKRPQTESEARKNMMIYLKKTAGYKLDFFKGMSYDEIRPIFQDRFDVNMRFLFKSREEMKEEDREVLKSINETPAQKAAKRWKLNKEAQEV